MTFKTPELTAEQRKAFSSAVNTLAADLIRAAAAWVEEAANREIMSAGLATNAAALACLVAAVGIVRTGDLNGFCVFEADAIERMLAQALKHKMYLHQRDADGDVHPVRTN